MSKRYREPVDVDAPDGSIEAFWWRGKKYVVGRVLSRWRETGGWWSAAQTDKPWTSGEDREIVRIHARCGRATGTYELARDLRNGSWLLDRVWD